MDEFMRIFTILLASGPIFAAALVGVVVAIVLWPKAPRPAKLVLIACVLEILVLCLSAWMSGWYVPYLARDGQSMKSIGFIVGAVALVGSLVRATLFGLLIWAAFSGRQNAASTPR